MKILNTKITALLFLLISLFLGGCSESISNTSFIPSLEKYGLSVWFYNGKQFENKGGTETGNIYSYNSWSFSDVPSWLTISPMSGEGDAEFTVTAAPNESMISREAIFHLSTNSDIKLTKTFTVSQAAADPYIKIVGYTSDYGNETISTTANAQTLTFDVETNCQDITASFDKTWATASYNNTTKKLTIDVLQYSEWGDMAGSRYGTIILSSPSSNITSKWSLRQEGATTIKPDIKSLTFDADGGSEKINVTVQKGMYWTVKTLSNSSWIELSPKAGTDENFELTVKVQPSYETYTREDYVVYCYDDIASGDIFNGYHTLIKQTGRYINLSSTKASVDCEGNADAGVVVESNIGWEITSCPSWLTATPNSGEQGETTITFSAEKNSSLNSRSGTVIISDSHSGAITKKIEVTQSGLTFGDNSTIEFGWQASTQKIEIPFESQWVAAVSDGWISLSDYSGVGAKDVTISVTKNESESVRTGTINLTTEGKNVAINVVQSGQYLSIDDVSGEIGAMGGKIELAYLSSVGSSHNIDYLGGESGWISVDDSKEGYYTLSVSYNPSINERTANFVIMPTMSDVSSNISQGVKYAVKQRGRSISVDVSRIDMNSIGGNSSTYIITADGDYTITKGANDYWYSLVTDETTNTFYIVVTENNSGADRTGEISVSLSNVLPNETQKTVKVIVSQSK